jgi:diguanylate cyclase (GGDEF)-like protein
MLTQRAEAGDCSMISLKKYLDDDALSTCPSEPDPHDLLPVVLDAYRSALLAMGHSGLRAYPAVGADLQQNLIGLVALLSRDLTPSLVHDTEEQVEEQLRQWGGHTEEYFKAKANDIKELLIVLARTAESLGERDQRYATRFTQFTSRLQAIGDLEDLTQVRASLVQRATELKSYVEQMEEDSHQSLAQLHAEVSNYETKLKAAEELALRDALTGLANRRNIEERIAWRIAHQQTFCVAILDLNHFKQVNDRYGHPAGDSLLQQFSQELRANIRCTDLVGRWSGDEFIVVLDSDLASAESQMERMRKWVLGDYTIHLAGEAQARVKVDAAIGVAQWRPGESLRQVIERADSAMYLEKKLHQRERLTPSTN